MSIKELSMKWLRFKEEEQKANAERLKIEVALYKAVMEQTEIKKEGTTNHEEDGIKLTLRSTLNVSVDQARASEFPKLFKVKYEYSKTMLSEFSHDELNTIQDIITIKPSKPTFSLSVL